VHAPDRAKACKLLLERGDIAAGILVGIATSTRVRGKGGIT
jgi:hypothetical protein